MMGRYKSLYKSRESKKGSLSLYSFFAHVKLRNIFVKYIIRMDGGGIDGV